jgi:hypothetical protein
MAIFTRDPEANLTGMDLGSYLPRWVTTPLLIAVLGEPNSQGFEWSFTSDDGRILSVHNRDCFFRIGVLDTKPSEECPHLPTLTDDFRCWLLMRLLRENPNQASAAVR